MTLPSASAIADLVAVDVLARAEEALTARRLAVVEDLWLVLRWADLHGGNPQAVPGAIPVRFGGDRLVRLGGEGTPPVQDLCLGELAVARQAHVHATRSTMADVLDLRHRLPQLWVQVQELACEAWVACKVASLTRGLTAAQAALVDDAVTEAAGCAPGRILRVAEAKVVEADPVAHAERLDAARRRRAVLVTPSDEDGIRVLVARLAAGDAVWVDATVDRVADLLAADPALRRLHHPDLPADLEGVSRDELRAVALGWLARPHDLATVLGLLDDATERPAGSRRPSAVLHVHLSHAALAGLPGVARVEELGPMLLSEVRALLGHAHVTLRPVLDLAETVAVDRYEHPTPVKDRTQVLLPADVFPHNVGLGRVRDHDHAREYEPQGPPGQTGDHNCAPLTRRSHRTKTHLGYRVRQVDRTSFVWRTPHGLLRHVDHAGTHVIDEVAAESLEGCDWLERALSRASEQKSVSVGDS